MNINYKKFIILGLLFIFIVLSLVEGIYIYLHNKPNLDNQTQIDYSKVVPEFNEYLEVQDRSVLERNLRILNCDKYVLTRPLVYPDRNKGEIYDQSLICDGENVKTTLISDLSKVEELKELYKEGEALSLVANPKNESVVIFATVLPDTDAGIGQLYSVNKRDLSFTLLKNARISFGAISPDQDKVANLKDNQITICNFITDECKIVASLPKGEGLSAYDINTGMPAFDITWLNNDTISFKVYYEDNLSKMFERKEKETRILNLN